MTLDVVAEPAEETTQDPRLARTRIHVLTAAQRMLADQTGVPLTFSTLALEAQVSRRTLYSHWGSIENLLADALVFHLDEPDDVSQLPLADRLRDHLLGARAGLSMPIVSTALLTLMTKARVTPDSEALFGDFDSKWLDEFRDHVGPITPEQYAMLIGPIIFMEFTRHTPASDEMIERIIELGVAMLGEN